MTHTVVVIRRRKKKFFMFLKKKREGEQDIAFIIDTSNPSEVYDNVYPWAAGIL